LNATEASGTRRLAAWAIPAPFLGSSQVDELGARQRFNIAFFKVSHHLGKQRLSPRNLRWARFGKQCCFVFGSQGFLPNRTGNQRALAGVFDRDVIAGPHTVFAHQVSREGDVALICNPNTAFGANHGECSINHNCYHLSTFA